MAQGKGCLIWMIPAALGVLAVVAVAFVVTLFLVKILWAWTVPDLFPGAVEQGLVAENISWLTSLKVAICAAVLAGIAGARGRNKRD
jgi:hypothetical protein